MLGGVQPSALNRAIYEGRLDPPTKGPGGSFLWVEANIQQASWLLRGKSADDVLTPQAEAAGAKGATR